jgi:hypothetical protein
MPPPDDGGQDQHSEPELENEDQDQAADEEAYEEDPDPAHAGPAEATDDPADMRPARDIEQHPGVLPQHLPDAGL